MRMLWAIALDTATMQLTRRVTLDTTGTRQRGIITTFRRPDVRR